MVCWNASRLPLMTLHNHMQNFTTLNRYSTLIAGNRCLIAISKAGNCCLGAISKIGNRCLRAVQNLESVFPSCCAVCLVLASCWALFNFYDSSHSWKQRKIDIQGDYGNVFLTQKMTQFLWLKLSIHYSGSPWQLFPNANQNCGRLEKEWMR